MTAASTVTKVADASPANTPVPGVKPVAWYRLAKVNGAKVEHPDGKYTGKIFEVNPHVVGWGQYNWVPVYDKPVIEAVRIPDGYILLPRRATPEMIEAGNNVSDLYRMGRPELWAQVYNAMVCEAPAAPVATIPANTMVNTKIDFDHLEKLATEAMPGAQIDNSDQCDAEFKLKMALTPELVQELLALARKGAGR